MLEKKPFSNSTLKEFETANSKSLKVSTGEKKHLIASPNMVSKFSPSVLIKNSPSVKRGSLPEAKNSSALEFLNKFVKNTEPQKKSPVSSPKKVQNQSDEVEENVKIKQLPVNRKLRINLQNIDETIKQSNSKKSFQDAEIEIGTAFKQAKKTSDTKIKTEYISFIF